MPKIRINDTINFFPETAISLLEISFQTMHSFQVLFDKIASAYFILAIEMASPGNHHCASCTDRHSVVPYANADDLWIWHGTCVSLSRVRKFFLSTDL